MAGPGISIILAVIGILVFIVLEAYPLFRGAIGRGSPGRGRNRPRPSSSGSTSTATARSSSVRARSRRVRPAARNAAGFVPGRCPARERPSRPPRRRRGVIGCCLGRRTGRWRRSASPARPRIGRTACGRTSFDSRRERVARSARRSRGSLCKKVGADGRGRHDGRRAADPPVDRDGHAEPGRRAHAIPVRADLTSTLPAAPTAVVFTSAAHRLSGVFADGGVQSSARASTRMLPSTWKRSRRHRRAAWRSARSAWRSATTR